MRYGTLTSIEDVLSGILEHASDSGESPAVKDLDRDLTYEELRDEAGRVALGLSAGGVRPGDRVVLFLPNSVDFVVAALASLWVGAVFVPLAVSDPDARLSVILDDCQPSMVVVPGQRGEGPQCLNRFHCETFAELLGPDSAPMPDGRPDSAAYAIYTSGTTGTPKGVLIGNGAFMAAVEAATASLGLDADTRTLCVSPFHFDGGFGTLFPTLFSGGAVVIRPREALLHPRTFFNAVARESITYTGFSPTYLRLLLSNPAVTNLAGTSLNIIALGGEASSLADIKALWAAAPQVQVFNRYGPTETTIAVTHIKLTPELTADGIVPMGRPHPKVTFHLVDPNKRIIDEPNQVGELYIGGAQLMMGYWGSPKLTSEVLRTDIVPEQAVYRTGDLVYRDPSGNYVYVDRADRVVKRSGVRISLVEMGDAMRQLTGVSAAACITFDDGGQIGIAAFVVPSEPVSVLELHRAARQRLPDNMLPDRIEIVDSLPLTPSSKLDDRRLLAGAGLRESRPAAVLAPSVQTRQ
jgi:D-alanine--poly(phosphoribitol) ligase subunit 1